MSVSRRDVLAALQKHPQSERLCARVAEVCRAAASAKQAEWLSGRTVSATAGPLTPLSPDEADTDFGNVLSILDRGAQTPLEWCLLGASTATYATRLAATEDVTPASQTEGDDRASVDTATCALLDNIAWLAAYTGCDAWSFLSLEADDAVDLIWHLVDQRRSEWSVPERLALAVGLTEATSERALVLKAKWLEEAGHPTLISVLEACSTSAWLEGELRHIPGRAVLVLQALTGYLFLKALARLVSRFLLWRRRRCRFRVSPRGIEILSQTSLLGRPFRERRQLIPLSEVTDITRQTRFSGLGLYLGLTCLILGTFLGTGLIVDAVRAPGTSASLLGLGLTVLLLGIAVDFAVSQWGRVVQGKGELWVRRRSARRLTLSGLDTAGVNELLERLSRLRAFAGAAFTSVASSPAPRGPTD